jgi:hypothetical protein
VADPIITLELDRSLSAHQAIVKAIVCLNFNEHEQALDILLDALSDFNFARAAHEGETLYAANEG